MAITINGQELPEEAIEFEYKRLLQFYSQHMPAEALKAEVENLKAKAKEQAIGAKLLIDEAQRLDLAVPAERVDKRINDMIEQIGNRETFEARLTEHKMTEDDLRKNIEQGCKVDVLVEKISEGAAEPTEAELEAHFESNKEQYVQPERAAAQHILIKPASDSDTDRVVAESRMTEIRAEIEGGAKFDDLAAAHSECPSGKQAGGSLGWFGRGMMVPEFDSVVFDMEIDALSDVIETQFGFHVIRKTGEDEGGEASLTEASPKIREVMRHARRGELVAARVEELRQKADIQGA
jgi:peptidyl-prolyl cis-trans isomerase C